MNAPGKAAPGKAALSKGAQRAAQRSGEYTVQFTRTDTNQKRRMRRHVRAHPGDTLAARRFNLKFSSTDTLGLSCKGRKRAAQAVLAHVRRDPEGERHDSL